MLKYIIIFLPSFLKITILKMIGAKIGKNVYIGYSLIEANKINIGDNVYIGHLNVIWRLNELRLENGSRIAMFNWISGARKGNFFLGKNSAITGSHYFESSNNIVIGENTIIAGKSSSFYTHGITPTNLDEKKPIFIGNWCYIGSNCGFVPGSVISDFTFVGMGTIVTKQFIENYILIGGCPAEVKKRLHEDDIYFNRKYLPHEHHPKDYSGV